MANEIAILDRDAAAGTVRALFLYPIASPAQNGGVNVAPTPSATLPPLAAGVLTAPEEAALDGGTSAFEVYTHYINPDITPQATATILKAKWATMSAAFAAAYAVKYQFLGTRLNAP